VRARHHATDWDSLSLSLWAVFVCTSSSSSLSSLSGSFIVGYSAWGGGGLSQKVSPSIFPYADLLRRRAPLGSAPRVCGVCVCVCVLFSLSFPATAAKMCRREEGQFCHDSLRCRFSIWARGSTDRALKRPERCLVGWHDPLVWRNSSPWVGEAAKRVLAT